MGVRRIFSRGGQLGDFSKNFLVGKSGEICFFPLETKNFFLLKFSKSREALPPLQRPCLLPHRCSSIPVSALFQLSLQVGVLVKSETQLAIKNKPSLLQNSLLFFFTKTELHLVIER